MYTIPRKWKREIKRKTVKQGPMNQGEDKHEEEGEWRSGHDGKVSSEMVSMLRAAFSNDGNRTGNIPLPRADHGIDRIVTLATT